MKPLYILFLLGWLPGVTPGQSFSFPRFENHVLKLREVVPPGWGIKDSVTGDLNKDGRADAVLVLEYADTVTEMRDGIENTGNPRILLILFKDSVTGGYIPVCQNNQIIVRKGEGGMVDDPYGGLEIKRNVLTVSIEYVRSGANYKFRWQAGDMFLIGFSSGGASVGELEDWDVNLSTRKARHSITKRNGDGVKDKEQVEWKTFQLPGGGIRLRDMKEPYTLKLLADLSI